MAQVTAPHPAQDAPLHTARRDHLRSVLPVALSVVLLVATVVTVGYVMRDLLDFGVWFLSQP